MTQRNDGGNAFPFEGGNNNMKEPHYGMSLRDAFAIAALPAVYTDSIKALSEQGFPDEDWREGVAMDVWAMADAMLAARERT